jgi:flavodoxin I
MKTAIFYGSTTGNTESAAERLQDLIANAEIFNICDSEIENLLGFDFIVIGCSTWDIGELQVDWDCIVEKFEGLDLTGKTVALFGTGDQLGYPESFVDAIGILHDAVIKSGAKVIGFTSTEGYEYDASRAERDGKFVGLALEDSMDDEHDEQMGKWVEQLHGELEAV